MKKATVVCTAQHSVDLDTGRSLGPNEVAENVDIENPHNAQLLLDGHLNVVPETPASGGIKEVPQ